ncbi:hypothetical protein IE53DRAFT_144260 [Violaceomyces palustris]|uniref:Uncharacterized protein n=1 Tax=Violaceomyces palustris TaxID=1673888 RepID=A0ACD0NUG4_9BASI|nr:hypothetical protein IE53DRAFT_144260 [Violaceomyces palustris]
MALNHYHYELDNESKQTDPLRYQGPYQAGQESYSNSNIHGTSLQPANPFYSGENPSFASMVAPSADTHGGYGAYDDESKIPLTDADEKFGYPPQSGSSYNLPDPNSFPMPAAPYRQGSPFTGEIGPEDSASQVAWAKRQQGPKRGLTKKVKLTRGHWIVDHPVPTAVKNSVEPKWSQGELIR